MSWSKSHWATRVAAVKPNVPFNKAGNLFLDQIPGPGPLCAPAKPCIRGHSERLKERVCITRHYITLSLRGRWISSGFGLKWPGSASFPGRVHARQCRGLINPAHPVGFWLPGMTRTRVVLAFPPRWSAHHSHIGHSPQPGWPASQPGSHRAHKLATGDGGDRWAGGVARMSSVVPRHRPSFKRSRPPIADRGCTAHRRANDLSSILHFLSHTHLFPPGPSG